ncbi:MAG TPA: hypothetical protein VJN96_01175 [Vicinamibacterales bacterium]|nr:hypothetical protein [Vicinamibacterales bacterium]
MSKLCPSAQPGMDNCNVLGVVQRDGPRPLLLYLRSPVPATEAVLAMTKPLKPTEVYRLSATCAEHKCPHFDGADCRLATRVVQGLPPAVGTLPPCIIRKDCRWYSQEGGAACLRCPEITTVTYDISPETQAISGLPIVNE